MKDPSRTNQELIEENVLLKQRVQELEKAESERIQMEEAYKDSELKYRSLIENSSDVVFCVDQNGEYKFVNQVFASTFGKTPDYFLGKTFWDIYPKEHADHRQAASSKVFTTGESQSVEVVVPLPDKTLYFIAKANPVKNETGKVILNVTHAIDITERKRMEEAERQSREAAEKLTREIAILADIGRLISSTLNIDEVYEQFAAEAQNLILFDSLTINLYNVQENTLSVAYVSGLDIDGRRPGDPLVLEGSLSGAVIRARTGLRIQPASVDEIAGHFPRLSPIFQAGLRSIMAVPLISRDEVIGVLHFRSKKPNAYAERDLRLAERIGAQIAGAIANAKMFDNLQKTESTLRENQEKYRLLFNNDRTAIYIFEGETLRLLDVNEAFIQIYGYSREDLLGGVRLTDISAEPEESASTVKDAVKGTIFIPLRWHRKKDGTVFPVEIVGGGYSWKGQWVMFGIAQDITDRKEAEKALQETESRFRAFVEQAPVAIGVWNLDGTGLYANRKFIETLGLQSVEEMVGRPAFDFFTPQFREDSKERTRRRLQGLPVPIEYESILLRTDGVEFPVHVAVAPIQLSGKTVSISFLTDLTENKRAEEEKQLLQEHLQHADKMEAIGTLAGGIAHDFNNLLMGIQGYTSLTLLDLDPSHPHYDRLKRIEEQVQSGADLTKQLLGFARGGRYDVKPSDMNEILEKSSSMFGRTKKEIIIHRKFGKDLRPVEVDRGQMEQVFMNLYVNAWQAMPGGGEIYLETEDVLLDDEQAVPYAIKPGKYVKIVITDTGTGMDEKTKARIFDPFFTTKAMGRGTGLGLATVYGIIKGHKGMIHVDSEPGHGTTFTIYLPASEKEIVREEDAARIIVKGTETILLVDDEKMVLEVSKEVLESMGYRVYAAGRGQEAIAVYMEKQKEIALVILDMIMPGISGGETFDRLREIDPGIKVLLSSGYSIEGQAQEILDRGCNGFLQKPFRLELLSRKVREMLD